VNGPIVLQKRRDPHDKDASCVQEKREKQAAYSARYPPQRKRRKEGKEKKRMRVRDPVRDVKQGEKVRNFPEKGEKKRMKGKNDAVSGGNREKKRRPRSLPATHASGLDGGRKNRRGKGRAAPDSPPPKGRERVGGPQPF